MSAQPDNHTELSPKERARVVRRRKRVRFFLVGMLIPTALALIYYAVIAPPQYASETQFTIQSVERRASAPDLLSGLGLPAVSSAVNDGRIVTDYIKSAAMVRTLRQTSGFDEAYSHFSLDPTAQIERKAPIEKATKFWRKKVRAHYDSLANTITVSVSASKPEDALRLAQGVLAASSNVVNSLNSQARNLTLESARKELDAKQVEYDAARERIVAVRGQRPIAVLDAQAEQAARMVGQIDSQIAALRVQLAVANSTYQSNAPQVQALNQQINTLQAERQEALARSLAGPGPMAAESDLESQAALLEYEAAQKAYYSALEASRQATLSQDSDRRFVVSFVPPQKPESSNYWQRFSNILAVALAAAVLLGTATLTLSVVRDHVQ